MQGYFAANELIPTGLDIFITPNREGVGDELEGASLRRKGCCGALRQL